MRSSFRFEGGPGGLKGVLGGFKGVSGGDFECLSNIGICTFLNPILAI